MTPSLAAAAAPLTFHTPQVRYLTILPVIVMLGGAVALLAGASLVRRPLRVAVATAGTVVISLTALGFALWQWADVLEHGPSTAVDQAVVLDGFSALVQILVPCAMVLSALVADGYQRREGIDGPEFNVLALVAASGAMLMGQANDLVVIFLGLEILSLPLYVLAAFNHRRLASGEAALKYFILGGFSSAIFVYGIALTYGATGSTNLTQIADFLSHNVVVTDGLLLAGLALLLVGFSFKIAAVPFHMWTPDVYQGAPSPVTGFMAAVAKIGGFAALLRVFVSTFGVLRSDWQPIVYAVAVITLLVGAGLAVVQRDIKRMLAYSSINTVGFILLGLQAGTLRGVSASLYYLFAYTFMVIGSFAVVTILGRRGDRHHDLSGYRGLSRRQPLLALSFAVLLLAQAGAPFTTGLWAKLQVVLASVDADSVPLATIAMVSAALAAFFYLRVAVLMYTPLRAPGAVPGLEPDAEDPVVLGLGRTPAAQGGPEPDGGPADGPAGGDRAGADRRPLWAGAEQNVAVITRINAGLLIDDEDSTEATDGAAPAPGPPPVAGPEETADVEGVDQVVPVPRLAAVAIGLCVAVTVVFGILPAPLIDFARQATLLFPH